ncbi:MAG TPA: hypothetical protein VM261_27140 [Kofleriaceae bacterium]|nr:hypothetical protein [Kofleriaceae bacterium]
MRFIYSLFMVVTLAFAVTACVDSDASEVENADKGGDKDKTCSSFHIEVTDKVPQLPDCYGTGKICKWKARITMCRYKEYIWGTGTWETDWTYSVSIQFVAIGCDGKTKAVYNAGFPPQKKPGVAGLAGLVTQLMDWIKNGAHFVDAMVGPVIEGPNDADYYNFPLHDERGCRLKAEDAEAHFDMLLTWLIEIVKKQTEKTTAIGVEEPASKLLLDGEAVIDAAHGYIAYGLGRTASTEAEQTMWAELGAAWLANAMDRVDGVTPTTQPTEFITTTLPAEAPLPGACMCSARTDAVRVQ